MQITLDDLPASFREVGEVLGMDVVQNLINHFGGEVLYVPTLHSKAIEERNDAIRREHASGVPMHTILRRYRVSRAVFKRVIREG